MAVPTDIKLLQKDRTVAFTFDNGESYQLTCHYLRTYSPSADTRHQSEEQLKTIKEDVNIIAMEPVGNYALKIVFDDGHKSGLYSWDYLYQLCKDL